VSNGWAAAGCAGGASPAAVRQVFGGGRSGLPVARSTFSSPERSEGEDTKEMTA
jgi:hypothetical protein